VRPRISPRAAEGRRGRGAQPQPQLQPAPAPATQPTATPPRRCGGAPARWRTAAPPRRGARRAAPRCSRAPTWSRRARLCTLVAAGRGYSTGFSFDADDDDVHTSGLWALCGMMPELAVSVCGGAPGGARFGMGSARSDARLQRRIWRAWCWAPRHVTGAAATADVDAYASRIRAEGLRVR
jgi:hypothetical protein